MQNELPSIEAPAGAQPTRRTIVAGAAWSIPVLATAVASPLAAASCDPALQITAVRQYRLAGGYVTQTEQGWGIMYASEGMQQAYDFRNPTSCVWTGEVEVRINIPEFIVGTDPSSPGWTSTRLANFNQGGRLWRAYSFKRTWTLNANTSTTVPFNWAVANSARLANLGPATTTRVAFSGQQISGYQFFTSGSVTTDSDGQLWAGNPNTSLGGTPTIFISLTSI